MADKSKTQAHIESFGDDQFAEIERLVQQDRARRDGGDDATRRKVSHMSDQEFSAWKRSVGA